MLDYILERCEQLNRQTEQLRRNQPLPYPDLVRSPIQEGEYYIWVSRAYPRTGKNKAAPEQYTRFYQCTLRKGSHVDFRAADYSEAFVEKIWSYLHHLYGELIEEGLYPCDDAAIIASATYER